MAVILPMSESIGLRRFSLVCKQKDWIALETFDMKTRIEVDFTQNKDEVMQGLYHLYFPGFSESNLFGRHP